MRLEYREIQQILTQDIFHSIERKELVHIGKREKEINDLGSKSLYIKDEILILKEPEFKARINIL